MFDRNAAIAIPSMPVCGLTGGVGSHGFECVGMPLQPSVTDFHSVGAEPDPLLGRVINDRYKIVEQIGHGGMGRVYKALQAPLDRLVALKVLGAGHDRDPNFYKRFFLEASVTAKLTHPNTITLYDYGRTEDGIFFIAMEYLNGRTLSAAMQQDGPLAQARVVHSAQQICRSLREAHALGIIPRDLKPANVMLLRQHDDHDFVKVLDFGLVKFFSGDNPEGEITNAGTFVGSPHYIAPEQARNQSPDQRCDIYSLGVLLYHMITGKVPFTASAPVDIILKHLHEKPVPPRELKPELHLAPEFQDLTLKCMMKSRDDRFQSMDEMLAQLKSVRTTVTGLAGPASLPPSYAADTSPNLRPVSPALVAQTPPHAQASLRTPSQPMLTLRTPAAGSPHFARPPPPPPEAMIDDDLPIGQRVTPAYGTPPVSMKVARSPLKPALLGGAAVLVLAAGAFVIWQRANSAQVVMQQIPAPPPQVAAASLAPAAAPNAAPAPAEVPAGYQTANTGTTLVTVTSAPG